MIAGVWDVLGRFRSTAACDMVAAVSESDSGWRRAVSSATGDGIAG